MQLSSNRHRLGAPKVPPSPGKTIPTRISPGAAIPYYNGRPVSDWLRHT